MSVGRIQNTRQTSSSEKLSGIPVCNKHQKNSAFTSSELSDYTAPNKKHADNFSDYTKNATSVT